MSLTDLVLIHNSAWDISGKDYEEFPLGQETCFVKYMNTLSPNWSTVM